MTKGQIIYAVIFFTFLILFDKIYWTIMGWFGYYPIMP